MFLASIQTSRCSAKLSAGDCRSRPTEAAAKSWTRSRRSARSIRPERFRGIRWRCAPGLLHCHCSRRAVFIARLTRRRLVSRKAFARRSSNRACTAKLTFAVRCSPSSLLNDPVSHYGDAKKSDTSRFAAFFREMLARGILLPPSQFEALFVSAAHTDQDIDRTIAAVREGLRTIALQK